FGGFGIRNNATISGNSVIEPRLSFNYAFNTKYKTQLRGGIGVSETVVPGVWLSNPYTNNGVTLTSATSKSGMFNPNPYTQQLPKGTPPTPEVDVTDPNFKLPTALKASLGFDRELPWGFLFSADYIHLQTLNGLLYQNLNYGTPTGKMPDGRTSYWNPTATTKCNNGKSGKPYTIAGCLQNPNFYNVVYLTNTNQGSADYLSLMVSKPFNNSLSGRFGIVLGRSTEVNPGTSSQAASNLNNNAVFNGNENVASRSIYSVPKRVLASLTWQHKFFGDYTTSVSAFYDGHTGTPYSWVFGNDASGLCFGSSTNCPYELVYIPRQGDVEFAPSVTAAQQQQFWNFINSNSYLRSHQGQVAARNGALSPWVNTLNLSLQQEVPGFFKGNKGSIKFDIYNFLNLLNKKWGDVYDVDFPYTRSLANFAGVDPATGKYIYSLPTTGGNYSPGSLKLEDQRAQSRWAVQVTLRYTF
ncbi:MAG: Oar protein, partial [Rhodanobacteraceae bacterium]